MSIEPTVAFVSGLLVIHSTDEGFMGSQSFVEFIKDSKGYASPFSMTIREHTNMFDWYEKPGRKWRAHRFATAMKAPASLWGQGGFASGKRKGAVYETCLTDRQCLIGMLFPLEVRLLT